MTTQNNIPKSLFTLIQLTLIPASGHMDFDYERGRKRKKMNFDVFPVCILSDH